MTSDPANILSLTAISKAFPGVLALDCANLSVRAGEIHGLVGENGAGKSTIIKVLAGVYNRDSGVVVVDGMTLDDVTPAKVRAAGIRFIHQELNLVPNFTVAESVFMGQELQGRFGIRSRRMGQEAERFLKESLNCEISGGALIRDLGVAQRKLVQIARALIDNRAKIVVFDKPTAPLASAEIDQLFHAISLLKQRGIAMIYVSHYAGRNHRDLLNRVTVFRNGQDVGVIDNVSPKDAPHMINLMVGRDISDLYPKEIHPAAEPVLSLESLGDAGSFATSTLKSGAAKSSVWPV